MNLSNRMLSMVTGNDNENGGDDSELMENGGDNSELMENSILSEPRSTPARSASKIQRKAGVVRARLADSSEEEMEAETTLPERNEAADSEEEATTDKNKLFGNTNIVIHPH